MSTCHTCNRPMRPKGTRASDHPGTVRKSTSTMCNTCYARSRRGSTRELRITISPDRHRHNLAAYNDWIAARRRRTGEAA